MVMRLRSEDLTKIGEAIVAFFCCFHRNPTDVLKEAFIR